jgi:hypothetical protein
VAHDPLALQAIRSPLAVSQRRQDVQPVWRASDVVVVTLPAENQQTVGKFVLARLDGIDE